MNRRSFLASLIATATLDPERLLWVPGRKTISVPPAHLEEWHWNPGIPELIMVSWSNEGAYYFTPKNGERVRHPYAVDVGPLKAHK